tara:strand:- start:27 stop:422 length:396 start_codon:yes stop_codon:yes gene_type:complete
MIQRLEKLRSLILEKYPESRLTPIPDVTMDALIKRFPDIPEHLLQSLRIIGAGTIGFPNYAIHLPFEAHYVYGPEATNLDGIVFVGDDCSETHEAYDTKNNWQFGSVGGDGNFEKSNCENFIEFLEDWFGS